jgi:O-6-methylguanine DNA methyltransferase
LVEKTFLKDGILDERCSYFTYECSFGIGAVFYTQLGLKQHFLPSRDNLKQFNQLGLFLKAARTGKERRIEAALKQYFSTGYAILDVPLDLSGQSNFKKKVYLATKTIGFAQVKTYKQVAKMIDNPQAYRAVGQALSKNRLPVFIPCHRVVSTNGLGGWSNLPGWKEKLLNLEERGMKKCVLLSEY